MWKCYCLSSSVVVLRFFLSLSHLRIYPINVPLVLFVLALSSSPNGFGIIYNYLWNFQKRNNYSSLCVAFGSCIAKKRAVSQIAFSIPKNSIRMPGVAISLRRLLHIAMLLMLNTMETETLFIASLLYPWWCNHETTKDKHIRCMHSKCLFVFQ